MNRYCYKVLSICDSSIFKNKKTFSSPIINANKYENIEEIKNKILTKYRYQSVTVFKFDTDKLNKSNHNYYENNNYLLKYDNVINSTDIYFDENDVLNYYKKIEKLE